MILGNQKKHLFLERRESSGAVLEYYSVKTINLEGNKMEKFANAIKEELDNGLTFTENGALAYRTTGRKLLDMNFKLSSYRNIRETEIEKDFAKVFAENPRLAVKFLFFAGDVRGGAGERRVFRTCLRWLAKTRPDWAQAVLPLVAEYNRWDSLLDVLDTPVEGKAVELLHRQLMADQKAMQEGKPASLCAKWLPSVNTSSLQARKTAQRLAKAWEMTEKQYRKSLSALRNYLGVTEVHMTANEWTEIDYPSVPSLANVRYRNAFLKHDTERRLQYLQELENGEATINASVTAPHEIVHAYRNSEMNLDASLEALWKALPDYVRGDSSSIAVVDGSGSMESTVGNTNLTASDVATGLGLYFAERLQGAFKDKYITFSENPQLADFSHAKSLCEKIRVAEGYNECANTNIEAVFNLILNTAVDNNLRQDELPKNVVIFSDMEFDGCAEPYGEDAQKTLFENISREYEMQGYKLPRLVFWNINSRRHAVPLRENENGVALLSGFSPALVKMTLSGTLDPFALLLETLNAPRYTPVETALDSVA